MSCSRATEVTTAAKSPACLRFFGQAPEYGKAPHSHTQGLTLKSVYQTTTSCAFLRRINPAVNS
ncbi:protein of unknown function [Pseudomonas mediterranea]